MQYVRILLLMYTLKFEMKYSGTLKSRKFFVDDVGFIDVWVFLEVYKYTNINAVYFIGKGIILISTYDL